MKRRGRRTKKRLAIVCLAALVVAMSVVWYGTGDPCETIATRLTHEVTDDPAARQQMLQQQLQSTRKEGAWACWMSVLFNRPTISEERHKVLMETRQIEQAWESGDENRRKLAISSVLSAGRTNVEVIEELLRTPDTREALRAALAYDPDFRNVLDTAIKEECKYTSGETPQACRARYTTALRTP
jgi:hypothetical protein